MFIIDDSMLGKQFFKTLENFFFLRGQRGEGKKYIFNFDDVEPVIFWSLVFEYINHFLVERREKNALGGKLFSFFIGSF